MDTITDKPTVTQATTDEGEQSKALSNVPENMIGYYLEIWKKTIEVQQHFNDLELRIRNLAITVLGAILGGAALSLKEDISVMFLGTSIPLAVMLVGIALIAWYAFYFMDRLWYHRLLYGAVKHGQAVEKLLTAQLPISLTTTIGSESPIKLLTIWKHEIKIHSPGKMDLFYNLLAVALVAFALILLNIKLKFTIAFLVISVLLIAPVVLKVNKVKEKGQ